MITPYYDDGQITIFHGDCREILPSLDKVDLVLTDPPYGIADKWPGGGGHGWNKRSKTFCVNPDDALRNTWDSEPSDAETIALILDSAKAAIIWGGNYFILPPTRGWLVWNKPERNFSLAEAELAWTTRDNVIRVFDCHRSDIGRTHPTQKPVSLMKWCLEFFPNAETIIDPFMGSGTTIRAAKDLGRRAIGIEQVEEYCEIAVKRLAQEVLF